MNRHGLTTSSRARTARHGFTLVELLIVVTILGIIASMVMARITVSAQDSRRSTFADNLKTFVKLAGIYEARTGQHLADADSGVCPIGFDEYIDVGAWQNGTPIGGAWDSEYNEGGFTSAIGVHFDGSDSVTRDDAFMTEVDRLLDDGNLGSGAFRKIDGARFYYILVP